MGRAGAQPCGWAGAGRQALLFPQCPVLTTPCPHSCGQVAGGHPQCWETIWATACRALQQSMESELRLAVQEQTMVRPHMGWAQPGAPSPVLPGSGALLILFQYHILGDDVSQCWQATGMGRSAPARAQQVRRAALHWLLQDECQQQEQELHQLGKAFYMKRL